jgi:hypothetical protein
MASCVTNTLYKKYTRIVLTMSRMAFCVNKHPIHKAYVYRTANVENGILCNKHPIHKAQMYALSQGSHHTHYAIPYPRLMQCFINAYSHQSWVYYLASRRSFTYRPIVRAQSNYLKRNATFVFPGHLTYNSQDT